MTLLARSARSLGTASQRAYLKAAFVASCASLAYNLFELCHDENFRRLPLEQIDDSEVQSRQHHCCACIYTNLIRTIGSLLSQVRGEMTFFFGGGGNGALQRAIAWMRAHWSGPEVCGQIEGKGF